MHLASRLPRTHLEVDEVLLVDVVLFRAMGIYNK
jgi:hypothetical protein